MYKLSHSLLFNSLVSVDLVEESADIVVWAQKNPIVG